MGKQIKLIALDLDGTLLNSKKELSQRNYQALSAAAAKGVWIVPTTGRLLCALPDVVRAMPALRYVIAVNGAEVGDVVTGETLFRADISNARALEVMAEMDKLPVIYDCYLEGRGWISSEMYDKIPEFIPDQPLQNFVRSIRTPVPDLKAFVAEKGKTIQKTQMFFHTKAERVAQMPRLAAQWPDLVLTSSYDENIEINSPLATKGAALTFLCHHLGLDVSESMSFGDGSNDISMLRAAGLGVAMENAAPEVKEAADLITASCDEDGVALAIEKYVL